MILQMSQWQQKVNGLLIANVIAKKTESLKPYLLLLTREISFHSTFIITLGIDNYDLTNFKEKSIQINIRQL